MSAVLGCFSDFRLIRSRSVAQIIVEVPIEAADEALKALAGFPMPGTERWVGVALAPKDRKEEPKPEKVKNIRTFSELPYSAQAGIRCGDVRFQMFLSETANPPFPAAMDAADEVRRRCNVTSRAEFDSQALAGERWRQLEAQYQAWETDQKYAGHCR